MTDKTKPSSAGLNLRARVVQALLPLLQQRGSLSSQLPAALAKAYERDRALMQQICYGTLRFWFRYENLASLMLRKPFHPDEQDIQILLNSALYQLDQLSVPDHAVISETVEACKQLGKPWAGKLLNAILRRYQREREELTLAAQKLDGYIFNHPDWMLAKLKHNWPDQWEQILNANDQAPPMCLRVNRQRCDRDGYLRLLAAAGIEAKAGQHSADAIYLESPLGVDKLPKFSDGWVSVQDEAAQLAGQLLAPQPGMRVLDACAAPGGKLCHLLELQPAATVEAVELEARRAVRIDENLKRLGLSASVKIGDASTTDWWSGEQYDQLLIDAPCSATGVIRRNPDIKILRRNEDILALASIQLAILDNLWAMLKPGGTLLYATCSIFPQENERIVERFIKQTADARLVPIEADWGVEREFGRQLFPQLEGHDGFFYARLERAQEA